MKINNVSLPYPVLLSNSDDILPKLPEKNIDVRVDIDENTYYFDLALFHDNEDIRQLVADGLAVYTCEILCPRTYLRRCEMSEQPSFHIELGRRDVFGRIEFNCYVTVRQPIANYRNSGQNEDYGDATFDMEPGDILASFDSASYVANLQYDKLYSAGSFMVVQDGGDCSAPWFDANSDQIKVYLPELMFQQFLPLSQDRRFNELFHASIVFNALFKTLSEFDEKKHGSWQWAEAIRYRIDHEPELQDYDIKDTSRAYELAQALLANPYQRLFNYLKQEKED